MNQERLSAREAFRKLRYGMFVHWGVYSLLGRGEWVMFQEKIPVGEYEKLPPQFNPVKFNAAEWLDLIESAGMRYLTITSKHHDGFCMYDSDLTDYKITNTPFKRDPIEELASECQKRGIALMFYYSPLDWRHPDYRGDWAAYSAYWKGQVEELIRKYDPIGIWLDGCWEPEAVRRDIHAMDELWKLSEFYAQLRAKNPGLIICNNHHLEPLPEEDIQTFEQDLPGQNKIGFNYTLPVEGALGETCLTINNNWGYHHRDFKHKSVEEIIRALSFCAHADANLLLNVGPRPDGTIQPEHAGRLIAVGGWLALNGEAIYGTRGKVFGETPWGGVTRSASAIYLHVWNAPVDGWLSVDMPGAEAQALTLLATGDSLAFDRCESRLHVKLSSSLPDPANTVLKIALQ